MDEPRKRPLSLNLRLTGIPEYMAVLRRDVADMLRDMAADEGPAVAARLRQIAAMFEAGQREDV